MTGRAFLYEMGLSCGPGRPAPQLPSQPRDKLRQLLHESGVPWLEQLAADRPADSPAAPAPGAPFDDPAVILCDTSDALAAIQQHTAPAIAIRLSASATFTRRQFTTDSVNTVQAALAHARITATPLWLHIECAFHCPYAGAIAPAVILGQLKGLIDAVPNSRIMLCDTSGHASLEAVETLITHLTAHTIPPEQLGLLLRQDSQTGTEIVHIALKAGVRMFACLIAGRALPQPTLPSQPPIVGSHWLAQRLRERGVDPGVDVLLLSAAAQLARGLPMPS